MNLARRLMFGLSILLAPGLASAARVASRSSGSSSDNILSEAGRLLSELFNNQWSVYVITVLVYYLVVFAIFKAALSRVRLFEGEGGISLNASGKILAHALSGLVLLGLFSFVDPRRSGPFSLLSAFGIYGEIVIVLVVFILTWRLLRGRT